MSTTEKRKNRKTMTGTVESTGMQSTVKVVVERPVAHPVYRKVVSRRKSFFARTNIELEKGDVVEIGETKPMSKNVRWEVIKKLDK